MCKDNSNSYGFGAQVLGEEPALPLDVYPLMIDCNGFFVSGALWSSHHERHPESSMTGYLKYRFRQYLKRERSLNRYSTGFDSEAQAWRKAFRAGIRQEQGESSASGLKDPKEEPDDDATIDLENRKYSFYLRPFGGDV